MAVDSSKLLERDIGISKGARISAPQVKMLKVVNVKLKDVSGNLKDNLVLSKVRNAAEKRRAEELARKKREKDIESKKGKKAKGGGKIGLKVPFIDKITNFLIKFLWGAVVMKLVDFIDSPGMMKFLDFAKGAAKIVGTVGKWILNSLVNLIDWGYKLVDGAESWIGDTFGEEAAEKFKTFMTNLKDLFAGFIAWKLIGEKIFKGIVSKITAVFGVLRSAITRAFKIGRTIIRQGGRFLNWATGGRAGKLAKNILGKGQGLLKKTGSWIGKKTGITATKNLGGKIFKHGAKRAGKRALLKMFGKQFVKRAGSIFGRVPIVGPLIVGLVSLVSGEPIGKALFKTFGAALGGFLGSIAGGAITTALAVASGGIGGFLAGLIVPASVMIGEIIGTFLGDALYGLIFEGGFAAVGKKFKEAFVAIGQKIANSINFVKDFIEGGFTRFYEGIPKFEVPDFPEEPPKWIPGFGFGSKEKIWNAVKIGLKVLIGPLSLLMGKEIPNILWLMNPLNSFPLLKNSFFPSDGQSSSSSPPAPVKAAKAGNDSPVAKSEGSSSKGLESYPSYDKKSGEGKKVIIPIPIHKKQPANIFTSGGGGGGSQSSKKFDPYASLYMGK